MDDVREVVTEVYDVGQLDKVIRYRSWEIEDDSTGHVTRRNQTKQEELPEDLMSELADEIGDGLAKVTVGAELGHSKEYGCKAQAFVSISVHCNNDDETIDKVQGLLHEKSRAFVKSDLDEMIGDRDEYISRYRTSSSEEPKPAGRLARTADQPPPRTKPKTAPKGGVGKGKVRAKKPNYGR